MAQLWIQFDVETALGDPKAAAKAVENWLAAQGYPTRLRHGEDHTWIGEVSDPAESLQAFAKLRQRLEQLLADIPSVSYDNCLIIEDPEAAQPAATLGPRSRPSSLAERAVSGAPA